MSARRPATSRAFFGAPRVQQHARGLWPGAAERVPSARRRDAGGPMLQAPAQGQRSQPKDRRGDRPAPA
eukprot:9628519-Lingulodinium_polyedra.AAC.1